MATIKFEMLSTAPRSQVSLGTPPDRTGREGMGQGTGLPLRLCPTQLLLAPADSSISTKGTKSGIFVMYNCARLATLFESYKRSEEQGLYPPFPPVASLDFSLLQDEVSTPFRGRAQVGGVASHCLLPPPRASGCCSSMVSCPSRSC